MEVVDSYDVVPNKTLKIKEEEDSVVADSNEDKQDHVATEPSSPPAKPARRYLSDFKTENKLLAELMVYQNETSQLQHQQIFKLQNGIYSYQAQCIKNAKQAVLKELLLVSERKAHCVEMAKQQKEMNELRRALYDTNLMIYERNATIFELQQSSLDKKQKGFSFSGLRKFVRRTLSSNKKFEQYGRSARSYLSQLFKRHL